ncbi:MAG: ABC transporter ATP-binding protein [Candidatus Margulisbacteria bacterium]|nr:ABC transporter ATP-binding protein [Candidatus Margulisiibacteriota bacterium]
MVLKIDNLYKSYEAIKALQGISLDIAKGELFGLLGPDGSGKSTLIRIIVTLLKADSGKVLFQDKEVQKNVAFVRRNIGYMPEKFSLYQDLTVAQNLHFFGELFGISREERLKRMEQLYMFSNLKSFANRAAGDLSGGMKQKLALSCMLMHEPDVIVLDEPTTGVDPVSRHEFWQLLHALIKQGKSILISTPYLEEASMCQRVGLLYKGRMLSVGQPDELIKGFKLPLFLITSDSPTKLYKQLLKTEWKDKIELFGSGVHLIGEAGSTMQNIKSSLKHYKEYYKEIKNIDVQLEDLFLKLIKEKE